MLGEFWGQLPVRGHIGGLPKVKPFSTLPENNLPYYIGPYRIYIYLFKNKNLENFFFHQLLLTFKKF
jgi:hypothetical protein